MRASATSVTYTTIKKINPAFEEPLDVNCQIDNKTSVRWYMLPRFALGMNIQNKKLVHLQESQP
jgi:hypothetical protein